MPSRKIEALTLPTEPLTDERHEKFCQLYVIDFNIGKAYRESGFSVNDGPYSASAAGSRLLKDAKIASRIKELAGLQFADISSSQQLIKQTTINSLYASPYKYIRVIEDDEGNQTLRLVPEELLAHPELVSEIESNDGKVKIKLMSKDRALEHLLKIEKLLVDKSEISGELLVRQNIEANEAYKKRMDKAQKVKQNRKK